MSLSTRRRLLYVAYVAIASLISHFDGWTMLQLDALHWLQWCVEIGKWILPALAADLVALDAAAQGRAFPPLPGKGSATPPATPNPSA